jgi:hypothetical protein
MIGRALCVDRAEEILRSGVQQEAYHDPYHYKYRV